MKYFRINESTGFVEEIFNFNPYVFIPNAEFLKFCRECDDSIQVNIGNHISEITGENFVSKKKTEPMTTDQLVDLLKWNGYSVCPL